MNNPTEIKKQLTNVSKLSEATLKELKEASQLQPNEFFMTPDNSINEVYGMPIGTIFTSAIPQSDLSVHILDGSTIAINGMYSAFADLLKSLIEAGYPLTCSQEEFNDKVNTIGSCGKFVIDEENNTIRLPKIVDFVRGLSNITDIGKTTNDSFKAHKHTITDPGHKHTLYAMSATRSGNSNWVLDPGTKGTAGSSRNSIDSSTTGISINNTGDVETKPKNIQYPYYIVLANTKSQETPLDIDKIGNDIKQIESSLTKVNDEVNAMLPSSNIYWFNSNKTYSSYQKVQLTNGNYEFTRSCKGRPILIIGNFAAYCSGGNSTFVLYMDGVEVSSPNTFTNGSMQYISFQFFVTPSKGTHNFWLYATNNSGYNTVLPQWQTNTLMFIEL